MSAPQVSIIVLNYNGRGWLPQCLDALARQQGAPPFETLLVDNGSTDGSVAFVAERYPLVRVLDTGANLGFAAGNNAGARAAVGAVLVFLNNDTVVAPDWLARLHASIADRAEFAMATSRIVFLDRPEVIDSAGDGYLRAGGAYKRGHGEPVGAYTDSREVFGGCGAALLIRRDVFEDVGGFDESFFMVYEDVDLSYRVRLRGFKCWYAADAVVRHAGSATLGRRSAAAVFYGQRNLEWTWLRNTPWPAIVTGAPAHLAYSLTGVAHYIRLGLGGVAIRAKLAALAGVPHALRARRRIQAGRRVSPRQLEPLMQRGWIALKRGEKRAG